MFARDGGRMKVFYSPSVWGVAMIDYRTHLASLSLQLADLAARPMADPVLAVQRDHQVDAVKNDAGQAQLGALADHLFRHAAGDGAELALLERAAALWADGLRLYDAVGHIRAEVETVLAHSDDPRAAEAFCTATRATLRALAEQLQDKPVEVAKLANEARAMNHAPEHRQVVDLRVTEWPWGDPFLARRTDAFVRATFTQANTSEELAFAFGVLSSFSANTVGSAYLGQVAREPRRSHRLRDRVAANSLGNWFTRTRPELRSCSDIADRISFGTGPQPELPAALEDLLRRVAGEVYDPAFAPPMPDLQLGYRRLVQHLRLLDRFERPAAPIPLPLTIIAQIYGDPADPPTPADADATKDEACGAFWLGMLAFLGFSVLLGGHCPEQSDCGERCTYWDRYVARNFGTMTAGSVPTPIALQQLTELAGQLFELQKGLCKALGEAKAFLIGNGLLYPDRKSPSPLHQQFPTDLLARALTDPWIDIVSGGIGSFTAAGPELCEFCVCKLTRACSNSTK